ncbi:MAG: hypothetical protein GF355_14350, partial [Candidatus Eisenbacteria bacterium]|nr:hypothetical protein [Candidatus Eisenbacteria bacterium]
MTLLATIWFLAVAAWVLVIPGWLTVELFGSRTILDRRERLLVGFLASAGWVGLLHLAVLATTGRLSTVLYGLLFLTLGQALLLAARRLDLRRRLPGSRRDAPRADTEATPGAGESRPSAAGPSDHTAS